MSKLGPIYKSPVAGSIPYDDLIQAPTTGSEEVQAILDYLKNRIAVSASPGFTWGRSGNVNANTWMLNDSVPSNISGRSIFLNNAKIVKVFTANQDATVMTLGVYTHDGDGIGLTLLGTVTTAAQRSNTFTVAFSVALNKQVAIKLESGSAAGKNMVIGCLISGDVA